MIAATALSDPAAATVGGMLPDPGKTWLGSVAHWGVGTAVLSLFGWSIVVALLAAGAAAVLESQADRIKAWNEILG